MKFKKISGPNEFREEKKNIEELFEDCYEERINERTYEKLYIRPPYAESIGIMGYDKGSFASFYGLVPQFAVRPTDGKKLKYLLGCTLMVHPNFRNGRNFYETINKSHAAAEKWGADMIMGFPNQNSFELLINMCGWICMHETEMILTKEIKKKKNPNIEIKHENNIIPTENGFIPPYKDRKYADWRGIKEKYKIKKVSNFRVGYKTYKERVLDVMELVNHSESEISYEILEYLASTEGCNKIFISKKHLEDEMVSELRVGSRIRTERMAGVPINTGGVPNVRFNLFMSDVY